MPKRPQIELSREELLRAEIPTNHVLVRVIWRAEGAKTKGGITIGFNEDINFSEDESFWSSDLAEIRGEVVKTPKSLYFNPEDKNKSMPWETDMELQVGDAVFYSTLEAKNSVQVLCEGQVYKSIPYSDIFVAKRTITQENVQDSRLHIGWDVAFTYIIPLNGIALLKPLPMPQISPLDAISGTQIDKSRGIIAFIGKAPKSYLHASHSHIDDLRVGDEVLFDKNAPIFYLERLGSIATFDGNNQYWVCQRRRIAMILNR